jgi:hypothetical protein
MVLERYELAGSGSLIMGFNVRIDQCIERSRPSEGDA